MKSKEEIRKEIWEYMEKNNLVSFPRPCYGRIPNFIGSEKAARKLYQIQEFLKAKGVFSAPDSVLKEARRITLKEGKSLIVALPHIEGYLEIKGKELADKAITIKNFKKYGKKPETFIEVFIQGSVAVDLKGNRLGKGKGYGDREYYDLKNMGLLQKPLVITIVHDCQVLEDFSYLVEPHDIKVNVILTPTRIIRIS
ncbi:MAG: 5-formyltetrahydrofolate cyclo-ligase [candidate division WOR-3 bacterium]|nr:5-formyltetrahydrofolate cyclo-ligase [candidate division WOR-3 bacterium]MCX7836369.1 5-formyltetrahydrofolate cyclo-ligase [candidate division WOR-3 bacterium]MDW8113526.1 5-formyltetrahydrofolate cyclo-ligase [candidate division WOR-3 bacterium]